MPRPSSSSFEAAVRGATKVKLASPKAKYCQQILLATQSGDAGVAEVFRTLTHRLRDSTWTVAFKALIIVHLMIKEGAQDVTLRYLAVAPRNRLAINSFTDVQTQGQNIRVYSEYLLSRAMGFERTKCDHVRSGEGRMKRSSVDKGLLRETEAVQDQIKALVKCDLLNHDTENEISLTAFRLLTRDLLDLYNVENEAVMNVLSRYFEMSRPDAERAIRIYKVFCKQTEQVVAYLSVARQYEYATRLEIPKLKHAPTSLAASLQEYLDDKDFEINRRQYLAEQEAKKDGKSFPKKAQSQSQLKSAPASTPFDARPATATTTSQTAKGPAPDLIDFFASIDQQQTPMGTNTNPFLRQQQSLPQMPSQMTGYQQPQQPFGIQPQMTGFEGSQNYQFNQPQQQQQQAPQPLQSQSIGAGFGGYGPQPTQQQQQPFPTGNAFGQDQSQALGSPAQAQPPAQLQPQTTNPFRLSMMQTGGNFASGFNQPQLQQQRTGGQSSNPFARSALPPVIHENEPTSPFAVQPSYQPQPLQPQTTGTNPFARNKTPTQQTAPSATAPAPLQVQATGSTNPFRQSMFVNQQTGQGWQYTPQATMGGLEQLPTMPVFPRPVQAPAQPQQQQQQSWL